MLLLKRDGVEIGLWRDWSRRLELKDLMLCFDDISYFEKFWGRY